FQDEPEQEGGGSADESKLDSQLGQVEILKGDSAGIAIGGPAAITVIIGLDQADELEYYYRCDADAEQDEPASERVAGAGSIKGFFAARVKALKKLGEKQRKEEREPYGGPAGLPIAESHSRWGRRIRCRAVFAKRPARAGCSGQPERYFIGDFLIVFLVPADGCRGNMVIESFQAIMQRYVIAIGDRLEVELEGIIFHMQLFECPAFRQMEFEGIMYIERIGQGDGNIVGRVGRIGKVLFDDLGDEVKISLAISAVLPHLRNGIMFSDSHHVPGTVILISDVAVLADLIENSGVILAVNLPEILFAFFRKHTSNLVSGTAGIDGRDGEMGAVVPWRVQCLDDRVVVDLSGRYGFEARFSIA